MSMNNDERLFMMMATIEQLVGVSTEFGPYRAVRNFVEF